MGRHGLRFTYTVTKMMSDSEDEFLYDSSALRVLALQGVRNYSVHPVNKGRHKFGQYHTLFSELKKHPQRFFEYLRMNAATFEYILNALEPHLRQNWTNFNKQPIKAEERLVVTLR